MQSQLTISSKLTEQIKENPEQVKALYFAYNKKKDYGQRVIEFPVSDNESFMSEIVDGEHSVLRCLSFSNTSESMEMADLFKNTSGGVRAGSILKLIPFFDEPLHRISTPIKSVRVLEFTFPVDSAIFSGDQQKEKGYNFKVHTNIYDFKRATAVTYHKNDEVFSIDIEEKHFHKEFDHHTDSNEIMYYFDWLRSHGNKKGIEFLQKQKEFLNRFKKRIIYTPRVDFGMENKQQNCLEMNPLTEKLRIKFGKKIDDITMEWIKTMPYIIRRFKMLETVKCLTTELCEEIISIKYQELIGMSMDNKDKIFSDLKKLNCLDVFYTTDVTDSFIYLNTDQTNDEYSCCGLQKPYKICKKNSIIVKSSDKENVLEGHWVVWIQEYSENDQKYMENYMVYIVDKKCSNI